MSILSVFASLLGASCSKKTVHVEFINAKDNSVIAVSDMKPDQLPESFAINTTLDMKNSKWSVQSADPVEKSEFVQTGKLRVVLSPITTMPPGEILFSLATISDDIGGVTGDALPSGKILALHEDDWRQAEFVSQNFTNEVEQELADIANIYKTQRSGIGFKKVHVRKRIPNPLANQSITLPQLEAVLHPQEKLDSVGFQRTRGIIPNSFAWKLDGRLTIWGVTDSTGIVRRLCVRGVPENKNLAHISETFSALTGQYKLVFVDWCKAIKINSDVKAFENYFSKQ